MQDEHGVCVRVSLRVHTCSSRWGLYLQYSIREVRHQSQHPAKVPADELPVLKGASSEDSTAGPGNGGLTDVHPVNPFATVQFLDRKDLRALDRTPLCPELHPRVLHQE